MNKITMNKIKGMEPFSGKKYGLLFVEGVALTESDYLAARLGAKKGFDAEKISASEAKNMNVPVTGPTATTTTTQEPKTLDDMNIKELQEVARENDLEGYSQMNKETLLAFIKSRLQQ